MTEFGLATVFGSVCFCSTFVPAFAHLVNFGVLKPRPALTKDELAQNRSLMKSYMRDMLFTIGGICLFYHFLAIESLSLTQCLLLLMLFLVYVGVIFYQQYGKLDTENEQRSNEEGDTEEGITAGEVS